MTNKSFEMAPASQKPLLVCLAITAILVPVFGYMTYSVTTKRTVTIDEQGLTISHTAYGTTIAKSELKPSEAKSIDLTKDTAYEPKLRTNGTGLPGLKEGWFQLANGEKALLFVTDPTHVAYIPTTKDYSVLVSVADPGALLAALK